jgi:chromosome segregation ATPase
VADTPTPGDLRDQITQIVGVIQHELELARVGDGYEKEAVAEEIVAKCVAPLLAALQADNDRLSTEGSPGVVHEVDAAFHKVAIRERDYAWAESARLKRERDEARARVAELEARHAQAIADWSANDEAVLADAQRQADRADVLSGMLRGMTRRMIAYRRQINILSRDKHDLVRKLTEARDDAKNAREDGVRRIRESERLRVELTEARNDAKNGWADAQRREDICTALDDAVTAYRAQTMKLAAEVYELHEALQSAKLRVRLLSREYGRASDTIGRLRGQLARLRHELTIRTRR